MLPKYNFNWSSIYKAVSIGNTIVLICENSFYLDYLRDTTMFIYDVEKNVWSEKNCSVLENLHGLSCLKYYIE